MTITDRPRAERRSQTRGTRTARESAKARSSQERLGRFRNPYMPRVPGLRDEVMLVQAGTVIGGSQLRRTPYVPCSISPPSTGSSSRHRSKTSSGGAQSRPITRARDATGRLGASDQIDLGERSLQLVG